MTSGEDAARLTNATKAWRDSLLMLGGRNRLLNYKPTKSSTLEFIEATPDEVVEMLAASRGLPVVGVSPAKPTGLNLDEDSEQLEEAALDLIEDINVADYPDHLFVKKTQRETDRALRNLARAASREYLDRGLSVLYLALGGLRWVEDNGDSRLSPLLFLPVNLRSDGPKQPHRVHPSQDDLVANPALAIRLREQGINLPQQDEVDQLFAEGGVAAVENKLRSLELPDGWVVEPLCVLSTFMFAKESMFRDLEANESKILESSLIQALSGSTSSGRFGELTFNPIDANSIDEVSPPESASLILDADATQRVAIASAVAGRSFVMDGPPGTGKSQTIANMIAALIADGKRVLFVSEKVVALDVVRDRLAARGLGSLLFELHSHKATRAEVAKALGTALANKPVVDDALDPTGRRIRPIREELTAYAEAMNEKRQPVGWTVFEAIGRAEHLPKKSGLPVFKTRAGWLTPERWEEIGDIETAISRVWPDFVMRNTHTWRGLAVDDGIEYDITVARRSLDELIVLLDKVAPLRDALGFGSLGSWHKLAELMAVWEEGDLSWRSRAWVIDAETRYIRDELPLLVVRAQSALAQHQELTVALGGDWQALRTQPLISPLTEDLARASGISLVNLGLDELSAAGQSLVDLATGLRALESCSARLADLLGVARPATLAEAEDFAAAARRIAEPPRIEADWLEVGVNTKMSYTLQRLREAQVAESHTATQTRQHFFDSITEIDVEPFASRWEAVPTWRRTLLGPPGADRQVLQKHLSSKPRVAFDTLGAATEWQRARAELERAQVEAREQFGDAPTDDAGFDWAEGILKRIESAHRDERALNLAALRRAQSSTDVWNLATSVLVELGAALRAIQVLTAPFVGTAVGNPSELFVRNLEVIDSTVGEIENTLASAQPFRTSQSARLVDAIAQQRAVHSACETLDSLCVDIERVELPGINFSLDHSWIEGIISRSEWTLRTRALIGSCNSSGLWEALSSLSPTDELASKGNAWDTALGLLVDHFEEEEKARHRADFADAKVAQSKLRTWQYEVGEVESWFLLRAVLQKVEVLGLSDVLRSLLYLDVSASEVAGLLQAAVLSGWLADVSREDPRLQSNRFATRDEVVEQFRDLDRQSVEKAAARVLATSVGKRPTVASAQTALISAEAGKKRRHIPVRDLISRATEVIQAIHPCFMMSPLAVSQYLPADIEFDVVIFDEASQVPPGDAINCIYRAKALIAAGDQRQLPPTSFFSSGSTGDDDDIDAEDDLANDYESLLDLMKSSGGFSSIPLKWHYRSRHEHLIAYSNNAFYSDKLVTFPGALAETPDAGVKFFKVDGVYRRSQGQNNPIEASAVADRVIHHLDNRPGKSIGVVAMSAIQRDAITDALTMLRSNRPDLERHFAEDRGGGIFVKSLEEVQGDERDVIVLSIGYGPDSNGVVYRNFGPINKKGGERRLNVAITRAKELTEVVSSMRAGDIGEVASEGGRHLRRYLDYAERGVVALEMELGGQGLGTDSPFEDSVISAIRSWGYEVQPQVGVSGFRIDIGIRHPNAPGVFMLGVECDGARYHSSRTARDRDRLRHEILVGLGWQMYHIWGLDWYRNRTKEEARLKARIESAAASTYKGRVPSPASVTRPVEVRFEVAEPSAIDGAARPSWMTNYDKADRVQLRPFDWTDSSNARHLVPFVENVVATESPVHIDTLKRRLRESSDVERVNKKVLRTLWAAVQQSEVEVEGEFVRKPGTKVLGARHSNGRTLEEVHDDELRISVEILRTSQVGARDDEIVTAVARAFGWSRTPNEMAARLRNLQM